MRRVAAALAAALLLAGCGDDGARRGDAGYGAREARRDGPGAAERRERGPRSAAEAPVGAPGIGDQARLDSALAAQGIVLDESARRASHDAAGFEIVWPSGCGRLESREPTDDDPDAIQDFAYTCDRRGVAGRGCAVYVQRNGRDPGGGPLTPPTVVDRIERLLRDHGVRIERQRPLARDGYEGVEVQAVQSSGRGELWTQGLLVGPHMYILAAWDMGGGLFDDPEAATFFASFRPTR